jgi:hypothetical protein
VIFIILKNSVSIPIQCYDHLGCELEYHALTRPLDQETLELPWLQELFAIREEVAPPKRLPSRRGRGIFTRRRRQSTVANAVSI